MKGPEGFLVDSQLTSETWVSHTKLFAPPTHRRPTTSPTLTHTLLPTDRKCLSESPDTTEVTPTDWVDPETDHWDETLRRPTEADGRTGGVQEAADGTRGLGVGEG